MIDKSFNRFVFIDTETGGINPQIHSLLQIGLVVWDANLGIIDQAEWNIKSDHYCFTKHAQLINKFNILEHNLHAKEPKTVIKELIIFLRRYFDNNYYIPIIGHNVQFDVAFLKEFFKKNHRSFNHYFSHRYIDTYSVYKTLVLAGKIVHSLDSSSDAFKYFNIRIDNRHRAISDCIATVELYSKLLTLLQH